MKAIQCPLQFAQCSLLSHISNYRFGPWNYVLGLIKYYYYLALNTFTSHGCFPALTQLKLLMIFLGDSMQLNIKVIFDTTIDTLTLRLRIVERSYIDVFRRLL